uniref:Uncharacterized protein n=1 Tax=Rhizophora mucronata TaxID=61149 RepID=A0A2P2INU9_RHIMU
MRIQQKGDMPKGNLEEKRRHRSNNMQSEKTQKRASNMQKTILIRGANSIHPIKHNIDFKITSTDATKSVINV